MPTCGGVLGDHCERAFPLRPDFGRQRGALGAVQQALLAHDPQQAVGALDAPAHGLQGLAQMPAEHGHLDHRARGGQVGGWWRRAAPRAQITPGKW
jgi:hypothetical protein